MFPTLKVCTVLGNAAMRTLTRFSSQMFGVGAIPWSPLARGLLTRTSRDATVRGKTDKFSTTYDMPFLDQLTSRYVETRVSLDICALLRHDSTVLTT